MSRSDPISKNYFTAVEVVDKWSDILFFVGAALAFASLLVEKQAYPILYVGIQVAFVVVTIVVFAVGHVSRMYLTPRAEDKRRQDFFSSACGLSLTHEKTDGYYNNDLREPSRRVAAQVLENSLFSKTIARRMLKTERVKVVAYAAILLLCILNRQTDLGIILTVCQVVFSEQVFSKWIRLEWLRARFERTFDDVFRLFGAGAKTASFEAMCLDSLVMYETSKASAAITLSSRLFGQLNPTLSLEWDRIKAELKI